MTGALAATNELGLDDVAKMNPEREIPLIFDTWEMYLQEAGICQSLAEVDFLEVHSFGAAPKAPNSLVDPEGYAAEKKRIRAEYAEAYARYWKEKMPDNGLPVRFTSIWKSCPIKMPAMNLVPWACYKSRRTNPERKRSLATRHRNCTRSRPAAHRRRGAALGD